MPKGEFEVIATEDIRAEPMTFKVMLIRCLDRIHDVGCKMAEKNTKSGLAAYEESIVILHCYAQAYYTEKNRNEADLILNELELERGFKDMERIQKLRKLLALIVQSGARVIQPPPIDVVYDLTTSVQKKILEEEDCRRIINRMLKEGRTEELQKWVSGEKEEKIKKPKPKISDIIDKSYLGGSDS